MIALFLSLALLCLGAGIVVGARFPRAWFGSVLVGCIAGLCAALLLLSSPDDWEWRGSAFTVCGEPLHLRLDGISAFFLALACVVGAAGAAYSREYWSDRSNPASAPRGRLWWAAFVLNLVLLLVLSNGLHFLIAWEIFTLSAYFLITLDRRRAGVRAAGWLYLGASHAGTVCLFAFFGLLAARTGSWDLGPMLRESPGLGGLFWLAIAGFGLKAGMFPLHIWLPSAHANAPSHVSAILSGVALKMGVYGLVRFSDWLPVPAAAGWTLLCLGTTGAVLGIAFSLAQNDLKRLLAYSSVENVGIILVGLGGALVARGQGNAPWGLLALAGALFHVWNHGLFKSLLFLGSGSVLHATGTREMSRMGGLWRTMPWTAGLFAFGAVAVSGLPPLNGFVGEWLVYVGYFDVAMGGQAKAWAMIPVVIVLAIAGALALASFTKACSMVFLGAPRTKAAVHAHECGHQMREPMCVLAVLCLFVGLFPGLVWPLVARAAATWQPDWKAAAPPAPLAALGCVHQVLAIAIVLACYLLWRRVRANGIVRGPTWDCGYAAPRARMQYTSGSFGALVSEWFSWILLPVRKRHQVRGLFPRDALRLERVPETVLERVVEPVARAVMRISTAVRRLQHGRLSAYILYLLAGVIALGVLVATATHP